MIYTDFVSGGETIRMFENLIKSTGRYRKEDRFEDFSSLFGLNLNVHEEELLNEFFFNKSQIKIIFRMSLYEFCYKMRKYFAAR